jgi:hypothetical protein
MTDAAPAVRSKAVIATIASTLLRLLAVINPMHAYGPARSAWPFHKAIDIIHTVMHHFSVVETHPNPSIRTGIYLTLKPPDLRLIF